MKGGTLIKRDFDLRVRRENFNLTQAQLAEKVGVDRSTIANIEAGRMRPSVDVAKRLGEALRIHWTVFFNE